VRTTALILALILQAAAPSKQALRTLVEARLVGAGQQIDARALAASLHQVLRDRKLLCDDCSTNVAGYVDDIRVSRSDDFLIVVAPLGTACGYDESSYVYHWESGRWRAVWEHEENPAAGDYLPQYVHDLQISSPDADGSRLLLELGSQTICGGAFKDLYARAWRLDADGRSTRVLNWKTYANDGYPPIAGRVSPNDVLIEYTADGFADGDSHIAVRHFTVDSRAATEADPIALRPHDFVLEWLDAPWTESGRRSESPSLEAAHAQLRRTDHAGDFPEPTLRCGSGSDLWQVATKLYQGPKRYYRVRWRQPLQFAVVDISDMPFTDCTIPDGRGEVYPKIF